MKTTTQINRVISDELKEFNTEFSRTMKSDISLLNIITKYILKRKGKQIRPVLVFLTAKLIGVPGKSTQIAASLIELLHTASLVHDDVVDDANERRGFLSINALWKSKIAVLFGDYLLSKGLLLSVKYKEYDILEITSEAVREMSEGELLQIQKTRKLNITEEEYFDIITKKTATLIAACTASGARSVTTDKDLIKKMKDFGLYLGIAFQIKDDLFDYEKGSRTGKPKGNDIKEKKLTLPLIYALENVDKKRKKHILKIISKKSSKRDTYIEIFEFVHQEKGVEYARSKMLEYKNKSLSILGEFPKNEIRSSLEQLVNYIVDREK